MTHASVESVAGCWQRDLLAQHRHVLPVQDARTALEHRSGPLPVLRATAREWANRALVSVSIRTPDGDLIVVSPD